MRLICVDVVDPCGRPLIDYLTNSRPPQVVHARLLTDESGPTQIEMREKVAATTMRSQTPKRARTIRALAVVAMALVLAFVSTGCMTGDIDVKVNKDGSGKIDITIFPTDELQQLIVAGNLVPVAEGAVKQVRDSSFDRINKDGRVGYRVALPFDDYQELGQVLTDGATIGETQMRVFSNFELTEINGNWNLRADLAPELLSDALRADPTTEQLINTEGLVPLNSDLRLAISLPGRITNTNGSKSAPGTAVWALKTNEQATIKMSTVPKPLLTDTQKVLVGALLAVVFGMFLLIWGSQRSWGSGAERHERKRAKKMRFPGAVGKTNSWDGPGPMEHAPEGTVPLSGPMPPRAIPTLTPANGAPRSAFAESQPQIPSTGELPPVAPPMAPSASSESPNPWAPHRPGAPMPGENLPGTDRRAAVYGTVPTAVPEATPAPQTIPTFDASPAAAAPEPLSQHSFPSEPTVPTTQPVAEPVAAQDVMPQQLSVEEASAHHDEIYRDPTHEMSGLENKVAEAHLRDLDPLAPNVPVTSERSSGTGSAVPQGESVSKDKAPWWFESEVSSSPSTGHATDPEPAWASSAPDQPAGSPFSTSSSSALDADADEDAQNYVAVGGGFFDYERPEEVEGDSTDAAHEPSTSAPTEYEAPQGSALQEAIRAMHDESGPAWVNEDSWEVDPDMEYPSIDGAGGLEDGLSIPAPVEEEMEYPSIDGDGDLGIAPDDSAIPPDWYPDPDDPNRYRWWDGADWTDYVSESGS